MTEPTAEAHQHGRAALVVLDPAMVEVYARARRLAVANLPVLIMGETGSGKELVAMTLHDQSGRVARPMIAINCAALHAGLVESELFGHERGAFSGAVAMQIGKLEAASGSTLFLDEVGELPLAIQAKLLRVLEVQRFTRLGDTRERDIDVRIVAATNRDLWHEVELGRFRRDLYFRLAAASLELPPLRARPAELAALARTFLDAACAHGKRRPMTISDESMSLLSSYEWPGNVRELKNVMSYAAAVVAGDTLRLEDVAARLRGLTQNIEDGPRHAPSAPARAPRAQFTPLADEIRELEITRLREALYATDGNATRAAQLLSVPLRTFFEKANQYGLARRRSGSASKRAAPSSAIPRVARTTRQVAGHVPSQVDGAED